MSDPKIRWQIARCAALLMYNREESEYFTAKRKAARRFGLNPRHNPKDLPSNREIREQVQVLADLHEGERRLEDLRAMRLDALRLLRRLEPWRPRLIGSVLTGHVRHGSDIDIHVFADTLDPIAAVFDDLGLEYQIEHKRVIKHGQERLFTHLHARERFPIELTIYASDKANHPFKSSITGKTIERASARELEALLLSEEPGIDLEGEIERLESHVDLFVLYRLLLLPLENVKQSPTHHPEGDALYHSLQVFELARDARPWDQEFLLAALLHDVGKGIDRSDHVAAALASLEGAITDRTAFLIGHHMEAHAYRDGELGARARRRLTESEDFEDLLLLQELDRRGRRPGVVVCSVDEALEFIQAMPE
ncbi:MAG: tRNA adenylyltransferase [Planctomycetota bacterium]|nr:tRNA adenylyltransferase [Planctomycetota bacterium]